MTRERRHGLRQTTRLRPGKLLGPTDDFLCDCAVVERSILGARIRAFAPVERIVPETITLYDEVEERRFEARVVWARGAEMGLSIIGCSEKISAAERHRIAGQFYAV